MESWSKPSVVATSEHSNGALYALTIELEHFDKHIKRLVYGGSLIESWPFLRKDDWNPLRLSLVECVKSLKHKNLPLIKYLREATDAMVSELEDISSQPPENRKSLSYLAHSLNKLRLDTTHESSDEQAVLGRSQIAEVVFTTAAAALCHHNPDFMDNLINNGLKHKELKFERIPLALCAAFGLKDRIWQADKAEFETEDDIFGMPLAAASLHGQQRIVHLILERRNSTVTLSRNALYNAACVGHTGTTKLLLLYGLSNDWRCYRPMEDAVTGAIRNHRMKTFKGLLEAYDRTSAPRISYPRYISIAIRAGAYDILAYLLAALDQHKCNNHPMSQCWSCSYIGNAIQEAVHHHNDGPLEQMLAHGHDPNALTRYGVVSYLLARRVKTLKLLDSHGVNLNKHMDYFLLRAVRHNWSEHISFLASIKKPSDEAVFKDAMARAVRKNRKECVKALLDAGFDPVSPCPSESEEKEEKRLTSHLMTARNET